MKIPFFRPTIGQAEIDEVTECMKSGWLTTGPKTKQFEQEFAAFIGTKHAVAVNSATAALHLSLESIGLKRGEAVLVPTMTFAATAEVVRYFDAIPILVDCRADNFNIDMDDAHKRAEAAVKSGHTIRAIMPMHYGGQIADIAAICALAKEYHIHIVEDAAHCCPGFYRNDEHSDWQMVGSESDVCCFSFYANKCITTGEGGMACTNNDVLADRMRIMSLHGISKDAWRRFMTGGSWYYEIVAPGFKYNLTDIASSIGIHQVRKANTFLEARRQIAQDYQSLLGDIDGLILPKENANRKHSWHLYAVQVDLPKFSLDRANIIAKLTENGIGTSVHWMPLHMHPYYRATYGYNATDFPVSAESYHKEISLPIFPGMTHEEIGYVASCLRAILSSHRR
jgi:dTDP-4-amino-4,6-dideoxygalactose transaminase